MPASPSHRPRRTKQQTRALLLDGALQVLVERLGPGARVANPLADIRITDAIAAANEKLAAEEPVTSPMTTGAAYNIWPDQATFQAAVLERVLMDSAVPQFDRVRAAVNAAIIDGKAWQTVLMLAYEIDFDLSYAAPTMFAMLGLTALVPPRELNASQGAANQVFVKETGDLLQTILTKAGRKLLPGRTLEDLVWALEALETGFLLRRRTHPEVPSGRDIAGRTAFGAAAVGIFEAFSAPDV